MKIKILCFSILAMLCTACSEEDLSADSVVDSSMPDIQHTELDKWIMDNYTRPYGIEVVYSWDKNASQDGTYAYPPKTEKVKPVLEAIREMWIDLYLDPQIGGKDFMQEKNPVKIYMYGGRALDVNGVEMIANSQASHSEMYIYNVNDFDPSDQDKVFVLMRSIHHQFAHRLAEVYPYQRNEFLRFSERSYMKSTDFLNRTSLPKTGKDLLIMRKYAMDRGFCTIHSMVLPDDDFAEMVSVMLMYTPNEIAQQMTNEKVLAKKDFIEDYFEYNVKISLRQLQVSSIKKIRAFHQKHQNP